MGDGVREGRAQSCKTCTRCKKLPWTQLAAFGARTRAAVNFWARVLAAAGLVLLLRPWWPLIWLPGWVVGLLLLWAVLELLRWIWWPRRWR